MAVRTSPLLFKGDPSGGRQRHTAPSVKTSGTRIPRSLAPSRSVPLFTACAARGAALPLGRLA